MPRLLLLPILLVAFFAVPGVHSLDALRAFLQPNGEGNRTEFTGLIRFLELWNDADTNTLMKEIRKQPFRTMQDVSAFEETLRGKIPGIKAKVDRYERWMRDVARRYSALVPEGKAFSDRTVSAVKAVLTDALLKFNLVVADYALLPTEAQSSLAKNFPASTAMMDELLRTMKEMIGLIGLD